MARIEPTDDQLQAAWQQRRRDDWPSTYAEVMSHPTYSRIVRMFACHGALMATVQRPAIERPEPPCAPMRAVPLRVPSHEPLFDRKRAAAGERDED
jgi:hypothetical protein